MFRLRSNNLLQWHERIAFAIWNSIFEERNKIFYIAQFPPVLLDFANKKSHHFLRSPRKRRAYICLVSEPNMHRISHDNNVEGSAYVHHIKMQPYLLKNSALFMDAHTGTESPVPFNISLLLSRQWITMHSFPLVVLSRVTFFVRTRMIYEQSADSSWGFFRFPMCTQPNRWKFSLQTHQAEAQIFKS